MVAVTADVANTSDTNVTVDVRQSDASNNGQERQAGPDVQDSVNTATLRSNFDRIIAQNESKNIRTSVSLKSLYDGRMLYDYNSDAPQFAASVNKLPVALLVLEDLRNGKVTLDTRLTWQAGDARSGFGTFDQAGAATEATVRELLADLLGYSGNTAVRALVNYHFGGPEAVNSRLAAHPELTTTRLQIVDPAAKTFYVGNSTSSESLWVIETLLNPSNGDAYQAFIRETMAANIFSYYGVRSQLEGNDFIVLANKVGTLDDTEGNNRHDAGIIYNTRNGRAYAYSFMTTTASGNVAGTAHAEHSLDLFGRQTLRYAGDAVAESPDYISDGRSVTPETRVRY